MRYIDPDQLTLPDGWTDRANLALEELRNANECEKSAIIKRHATLWVELKTQLEAMSSRKCWYCEIVNDRSDNAVDHYRPKNRVCDCDSLPCGYWWLAFDERNYRYSCTFCNSTRVDRETGSRGGKHDHFPLFDETRRATTEEDDIENEQPLILDPCKPSDPAHLWFNEDGTPSPNPNVCQNTDDYPTTRADETITLLHLHHARIVDRRKELCLEMRRLAESADKYLQRYANQDETAKEALDEKLSEMLAKCNSNSELSQTARCMLKGMRTTSQSANAVLECIS
jgi:uncharacterized protein (TIGR02646 family)